MAHVSKRLLGSDAFLCFVASLLTLVWIINAGARGQVASKAFPTQSSISLGNEFSGSGYLVANHGGMHIFQSVSEYKKLRRGKSAKCVNITVVNNNLLKRVESFSNRRVGLSGYFTGFSPILLDTGSCGRRFVLVIREIHLLD